MEEDFKNEDYYDLKSTTATEKKDDSERSLTRMRTGLDESIDFENFVQVVSFLVGSEEYGIEILHIHEINRISQITRLPNTPNFIRGIMNLRGNVIPVIDLREKFGLPYKKFDEDTRVIVIEMENKLIAVIVDAVNQTLRIRNEDVEFTTNMITVISGNYIKGVAKYKDRLVILLKLSSSLLEEETEEEKNSELGS